MPPLTGFSDNPFKTRADYLRAASALVRPLIQYRSPLAARIKLPSSNGAGFSETAAQLEGFARPLWAIPHLLQSCAVPDPELRRWIEGLKAGTDPHSGEYWGDLRDYDQRMVEMESIAYAILCAPECFSFNDDEAARRNLVAWLIQINHHEMPKTNWLWFRVLVNVALYQQLGVPLELVKIHIDQSLDILDTFYLGDGWSSDGVWSEERKQADYYSGSFALQFAPLIFVRFAPGYDPNRTNRYKDQAKDFARQYWRYFSPTGAPIPFGRSLTYRFAFAAFWAAASAAEIDLPELLEQTGLVKGLLRRHLRWWACQDGIFNVDGTLHIGYTYPNMHLAEDYTSPQSPYWCLKSFLVLGLADGHPFWKCEELVYHEIGLKKQLADKEYLGPPGHLICNTDYHHFLLSAGQSTTKKFRSREAKYGKFAYSSAFPISVPCGQTLEQIAPDCTLAITILDGEYLWKVRWAPYDITSSEIQVGVEKVPILTSSWKPWKGLDMHVVTTLVAPCRLWPGWHLRIHRVKNTTNRPFRIVDGGFALSAETKEGDHIPDQFLQALQTDSESNFDQGWCANEEAAVVCSKTGVSGIADLTPVFPSEQLLDAPIATMKAEIISADPNT